MKKVCFSVLLLLFFFLSVVCFSAEQEVQSSMISSEEYEEEFSFFMNYMISVIYSKETVTFEDTVRTDGHGFVLGHGGVLLNAMFESGILTKGTKQMEVDVNNPDGMHIPAQTVREVFDSIFGAGSFDLNNADYFSDYEHHLLYDSSDDTFVYLSRSTGGGAYNNLEYARFLRGERKNDEVYLYMLHGMEERPFIHDWPYGDNYGIFETSQTEDDRAPLALFQEQWDEDHYDFAGWSRLYTGELDEYLPIFKVTFKENGKGGYYWVSSEMIVPGVPIPEEALGLIPAEEEPSTEDIESSQSTDSDTPDKTDQTTDIPTLVPSVSDLQTPAPSDDSAPLWGVIVGWGFVGAALIVGAVLLVKGYKKK